MLATWLNTPMRALAALLAVALCVAAAAAMMILVRPLQSPILPYAGAQYRQVHRMYIPVPVDYRYRYKYHTVAYKYYNHSLQYLYSDG